MVDCNIFYVDGELIPMRDIPTWYIQFLASSPPDKDTENKAKKELKNRGENY